jgi:hypothetical protein
MEIYRCECGGIFRCAACDALISRKAAEEPQPLNAAAAVSAIQRYLTVLKREVPFGTAFPRGPRGGAMITFGQLMTLECFLPYEDEESGDLLPFVPMPLIGETVHDAKAPDRDECEAGRCACDRPTGWRLTRPILRALLGVSDAFLNEHGGELPGRLPCWCLCVDTLTFFRECFFNPDFRFPTRKASRAARHERLLERGWTGSGERREDRSHKPPRPRDRGKRQR